MFLLFPILIFAQDKIVIYNPTNKIYYGAEVGTNDIISNSFTNGLHPQFGIMGEYFLTKNWSFLTKIKYYQTSVSYKDPSNFETTNTFLTFKGNVVSVPVTINYSIRLNKNFKVFAAIGFAYNIETNNNYQVPSITNPNFSNMKSNYFTQTSTIGFTNAISKTDILYISIEGNKGSNKGYDDQFLIGKDVKIQNVFLNLGIKHNFKK